MQDLHFLLFFIIGITGITTLGLGYPLKYCGLYHRLIGYVSVFALLLGGIWSGALYYAWYVLSEFIDFNHYAEAWRRLAMSLPPAKWLFAITVGFFIYTEFLRQIVARRYIGKL